jgi:Rrf2 family protein
MEKRGMPRPFMAQIANNLVGAGIINSKEGRNGGYALNYEPKMVQIKEALEAIEGEEVAPVTCLVSPGSCPVEKTCGQKSFMGMFTNDIETMLSNYSLADLIKNA